MGNPSSAGGEWLRLTHHQEPAEYLTEKTDNFKAFLGNPQEGVNHIAFVVDNLEEAVKNMEKKYG